MIVKMKKLTVLISTAEKDAALIALRDLGIVHIDAVKAPASEEIFNIETALSNTEKALLLIGATGSAASDGAPVEIPDVAGKINEINDLAARKDALLRELSEYQKHNRWFDDWGAVSLASLELIREAGVNIRFYICPAKALKDIPSTERIQIVRHIEGRALVAHFSDPDSAGLAFPEDLMPAVEVAPMRQRMTEIETEIKAIDNRFLAMSSAVPALRAKRDQLLVEQEFSRVKFGMGEAESIVYLQGYCPENLTNVIRKTADAEGWGYVLEDPDDPRDVPTLVKTKNWIQMIQPVFSFMGTVPGYNEFDISFWFLLFFSLFYAMLVGDAGYGIIFLVATFAAHLKFRHKAPWQPFGLMYVLSIATIGWGAISGTWFGMTGIFDIPAFAFLKNFVIQPVSSIGGDQDFMMFLCFFIGAIHLTIAHSIIAARSIKTPNSIAQLGWISVIWGLFFVAGKLVLGKELPPFAMPLLVAGLILVMMFENFQKRMFFKGALTSLANLPLSVIGAFSDVVSYLRLFAVGFATFIVASSFNQMAADAANGFVGTLVAAIIIFLGHTINIILAVMAVVVHGIRLNMLEFSGHLNMQWSGKPYQPFSTVKEVKTL